MGNKVTFLAVAGLVCALAVAGSAQANMVPNAGFEIADVGDPNMPADWTILQSADKVVWSDEAYTGSKCMELQYNNPEAIISPTERIAVTAGTEYTFGACLKSTNGAEAVGPNARLKWFDAAGDVVEVPYGWNNWQWYAVTAPVEWTELTAVTIEAPAGAASVEYAWLYTWKGDSSSGVYIDDVSMTPEPATMGLLALGGLAMLRRRRRA